MIKPSTVSTYETSESKANDVAAEVLNKQSSGDKIKDTGVHVESPLQKLNELNFVDIKLPTKPANLVAQTSTESLLPEPGPEPQVEIKDNREEYTGFTIAYKDTEGVTLRLKRQESLSALQALLDIPQKAEDEKRDYSREVIEIFSNARVCNKGEIEPNPYSNPEHIWTGLEITVLKKDEPKTYVLMSLGYAKWIVDEPKVDMLSVTSSADSGFNYWNVDTAEIVREEGKGPYVKLNIDNDNAVCLRPRKATREEMKRFMTPHWSNQRSPSTEAEDEEVRLSSKVPFST